MGRFLGWLKRGEQDHNDNNDNDDDENDGHGGHAHYGYVERKRIGGWDEKNTNTNTNTKEKEKEKGKEGHAVSKTSTSTSLSEGIKAFLQPTSTPSPSPKDPKSPHSSQNINTTTTTSHYPTPLPPLKPIWLLASAHLEHTLGTRLSWSSFTCVAESRVELSGEVPAALQEKEVARKVRKAEGEGVGVGRWMGRDGFCVGVGKGEGKGEEGEGEELNEYDIFDGIHIDEENARGSDTTNSKSMPLSLKHTIDARIREWRDSRAAKGGQVRLTEVEVWRDYVHREYFVALAPRRGGKNEDEDEEGKDNDEEGEKEEKEEEGKKEDREKGKKERKEGKEPELIPVALVVLHQLSPMYGFQVKYALDFPSTERWRTGSTSGECLLILYCFIPLLLVYFLGLFSWFIFLVYFLRLVSPPPPPLPSSYHRCNRISTQRSNARSRFHRQRPPHIRNERHESVDARAWGEGRESQGSCYSLLPSLPLLILLSYPLPSPSPLPLPPSPLLIPFPLLLSIDPLPRLRSHLRTHVPPLQGRLPQENGRRGGGCVYLLPPWWAGGERGEGGVGFLCC